METMSPPPHTFTPTKFRWSKFPGHMHNYIWCPYYLPSFMKFCSVVSEELRWQTVWGTDGRPKQYVLVVSVDSVIHVHSVFFVWYFSTDLTLQVKSLSLLFYAFFNYVLSMVSWFRFPLFWFFITISFMYSVSLLPTKFHEILLSSFRGVTLTSCFRSIFGEIFKFKEA
jgi:hypothetical protein